MNHKISYFIVLVFFLAATLNACNHRREETKLRQVVVDTDTALQRHNGKLWYHAALFNGESRSYWPNGTLRITAGYTDGLLNGRSLSFYNNGNKESSRFYTMGEKDSVHTGWWENGNLKYEYHFSRGNYNGMFTQWYENGRKMQQVMYANGEELYGQGWRESGKLYMNFRMCNGRRYGMNNSNLCYPLNNEVTKEK